MSAEPSTPDLSGAPLPRPPLSPARMQAGQARLLGPPGEPAALAALARWVPAAPARPTGRLLATLWAAPMTLAGLLLGATSVTRPRRTEGVVLFAPARGPVGRFLRWRGFTAAAWGHTVLARIEPSRRLLDHELVHVRQAERLGPAFPVLYLALLAIYGYQRHPMERAARLGARRAAGVEE